MASQAAMKASDRLRAARAAKEATLKKISDAEGRRKDALLKGDDPAAATVDHDLTELRAALKRREDEIGLLPALISAEEQEARLPSNPAAARALLAEKKARLQMLQCKRWNELDAATNTERDSLPIEIGRLTQAIESMERMAQ
jgi:hypothetical protein